MDVVTIGHASIDKIEMCGEGKEQLGGAAVYSAMAAKIFCGTGIVSRVGRDFPSKFLKILKDANIATVGLKKLNGRSTFFSIKYDENGFADYNDFKLNVGRGINPRDIPLSFLRARAFHIAPMNPDKQLKFINFLRENSYGLISLNTYMGYVLNYKKELVELIDKVDIFTINDDEAMTLTDTKSLEHALNALKRLQHELVVVTMGVYGSIIIQNGEINFFPSLYQPEVVDLTGCGDAFAGAFLSSYLKTDDALKAANIANSVASITATDWNFNALRSLEFKNLEKFQEFVVSRQRRLKKRQRTLEYFFG